MVFTLGKIQREALFDLSVDQFRARVVEHCYNKIRLDPVLSRDDFFLVGNALFDRVHSFLKTHPTASYDSYVRMVLLYFLRGVETMEGRDVQTTLQNPRIAINTRVRVTYDVTRYLIEKGY